MFSHTEKFKFHAAFRFYEELNNFLAPEKRKTEFDFAFNQRTSIKDAIESLGIPHTEVDLILVNSAPVSFDYILNDNDKISVFPVFETFDISNVSLVRKKPLRNPKFILDVHLGKLSTYMRMLGLDCLHDNQYEDKMIIKIAHDEHRIILTRDKGILKHKVVENGYFVRATNPNLQLIEVIQRFSLERLIKPFSRCLECNEKIIPIDKEKILHKLPDKTKDYYKNFYYCKRCHRVYWHGPHYDNMLKKMDEWNLS